MEPSSKIQAEPEAKKRPDAPKAAPRRGGIFESVWVDIAGVAATLAAGLGSAAYHINHYFFRNADKDRLFSKEIRDRQRARKSLSPIIPQTNAEAIDRSHAFDNIRIEYDKAIKKQTEKLGYKWPWQKWQRLHSHQRSETLIKAGTSITVALGAVVSLMALWSMSKKQDEFEKHINDMNSNGHQR